MREVLLVVPPVAVREVGGVRGNVDALDVEGGDGAREEGREEERDAARACAEVEDGEVLEGWGVCGEEVC